VLVFYRFAQFFKLANGFLAGVTVEAFSYLVSMAVDRLYQGQPGAPVALNNKGTVGIDAKPDTMLPAIIDKGFRLVAGSLGFVGLVRGVLAGVIHQIAAGYFAEEIVPVEIAGKMPVKIDTDEHPRPETTLEGLGKLKTPFRDPGTVTAGNASGITDGAAALVLASERAAQESGRAPLGWIRDFVAVGVEPRRMGIGPVPAVRALLERNQLKLSDVDLIELNEAFAAQVIACERELKFDRERVNVNGGSISLGHPIGCSGARIAVTLLHQMRRTGAKRGIATLCISGGMGMAMLIENE
jgi:hypothetical protein